MYIDIDSKVSELPSNHLTVESSGIIRKRTKRFAQPRIIRVRASSSASSRSSLTDISYDSATLSGSGHEVTTKKRKLKGFRFDSTTLPGSKNLKIQCQCMKLARAQSVLFKKKKKIMLFCVFLQHFTFEFNVY